jgi:NADH-quinone oxidoreductase subunit M
MALVFFPALWLWATGDFSLTHIGSSTPHWQREFSAAWIPLLGINFHLAIDGLSVIMVMLAGLLGMVSVVASWSQITERVGAYHFLLLWTLFGVVGVFLAADLFLFFFFWEMMLIPMYLMIALWGHGEFEQASHIRASIKFFIYTQTSGLFMLAGILGVVFVHYSQTGDLTFNYNALLNTDLSGGLGYALMLGFFFAFAVKLPVVPLHGWLAETQANAPSPGAVDLSGILVKTAAYGFLRYSLPLFPEASSSFAVIGMALGIVSIYYGAVMAFAQTDMKRLISYSSIAHMGFVVVGVYAGTVLALQGVLIQVLASAISTAALFVISGQIYARVGTRDMRRLGGLFGRLGALPGFALIFVIATLGMPATANFIGEFLILFGTFGNYPVIAGIAAGGMLMAALYSWYLMQRVYWGRPSGDGTIAGLHAHEYAMMLVLVLFTLVIGLYPNAVLSVSQGTMHEISHWFAPGLAASPVS